MALPCCKKRCNPCIPQGFVSKRSGDIGTLFQKCSTHTHKHFHQHYHEKVEPDDSECLLNAFAGFTVPPGNPGVSIDASGLIVDGCCGCGYQNCLRIAPLVVGDECKLPVFSGTFVKIQEDTSATEVCTYDFTRPVPQKEVVARATLAWSNSETGLFPDGYWRLTVSNPISSKCEIQKIAAAVLLNDLILPVGTTSTQPADDCFLSSYNPECDGQVLCDVSIDCGKKKTINFSAFKCEGPSFVWLDKCLLLEALTASGAAAVGDAVRVAVQALEADPANRDVQDAVDDATAAAWAILISDTTELKATPRLEECLRSVFECQVVECPDLALDTPLTPTIGDMLLQCLVGACGPTPDLTTCAGTALEDALNDKIPVAICYNVIVGLSCVATLPDACSRK